VGAATWVNHVGRGAAGCRRDRRDNAIDASQLTLVKSVKPTYPTKAEQAKTEGWVELDFTVAETGEIEDIAVHAANPPGVFDDAARARSLPPAATPDRPEW
jgi:TonB family protein